MPTYDYKCEKCDHRWEMFQQITADPIRKCPACKSSKAKRVIGPGAGILFKGSGFYQTDYRSESYKKGADSDKKSQESASATNDSSSKASGDGKSSDSTPKSESKAKS